MLSSTLFSVSGADNSHMAPVKHFLLAILCFVVGHRPVRLLANGRTDGKEWWECECGTCGAQYRWKP